MIPLVKVFGSFFNSHKERDEYLLHAIGKFKGHTEACHSMLMLFYRNNANFCNARN